jgi:hypothetical protein
MDRDLFLDKHVDLAVDDQIPNLVRSSASTFILRFQDRQSAAERTSVN